MGSAPVRRGFEARMLSSQRRGSPVGPGMPGVYAVRRTRTVQQSTPAPSGPPAAVGDWVQPDDVETSATVSGIFFTERNVTLGGYSLVSTSLPDNADVEATWQTIVAKLSADNLSADPVSPSPPPGMTVEYETPDGLLLDAILVGRVVTTTAFMTDLAITEVWEALTSDMVPGQPSDNVPGNVGPTHTAAGNPVWSQTGDGTWDFTTPAQDFGADQIIGWRIGEIHALNETEPPYGVIDEFGTIGGSYHVFVEGQTVGSHFDVTYTYRPPRYRFV